MKKVIFAFVLLGTISSWAQDIVVRRVAPKLNLLVTADSYKETITQFREGFFKDTEASTSLLLERKGEIVGKLYCSDTTAAFFVTDSEEYNLEEYLFENLSKCRASIDAIKLSIDQKLTATVLLRKQSLILSSSSGRTFVFNANGTSINRKRWNENNYWVLKGKEKPYLQNVTQEPDYYGHRDSLLFIDGIVLKISN